MYCSYNISDLVCRDDLNGFVGFVFIFIKKVVILYMLIKQ